jgi:hypothetical protein
MSATHLSILNALPEHSGLNVVSGHLPMRGTTTGPILVPVFCTCSVPIVCSNSKPTNAAIERVVPRFMHEHVGLLSLCRRTAQLVVVRPQRLKLPCLSCANKAARPLAVMILL